MLATPSALLHAAQVHMERVDDRVVVARNRRTRGTPWPATARHLTPAGLSRIVRERYVRTDLAERSLLASARPDESAYVLVDADTVERYVELLELAQLTHLLVPETVVNSLRDRNAALYRRLLYVQSAILRNETIRATYVPREAGTDAADHHRRAIAKAVAWLCENATGTLFVVAEDEHLRTLLSTANVRALVLSMGEYVDAYCSDHAEVRELYETLALLANETVAPTEGSTEANYAPYLSEDDLAVGLKSNRLVAGTLEVDRFNTNEALVTLEGAGRLAIRISSWENRNRALHGDKVVVQIVAAEVALTDMLSLSCGSVVGILERPQRTHVCTTSKDSPSLVTPYDRRIPRVRLRMRNAPPPDSRILVRIDEWPVHSAHPVGHYVRSLGQAGSLDTEMATLLHEHNVATSAFTDRILADLPPPTWCVSEHELATRRDLRAWRIMSIDPKGSEDVDDALSVEQLPSGLLRIGVHIADVSAFVHDGSLLDAEAQARGTSVYLADRRINMLPPLLSERLCSLRAGEERLAVSAVWEVEPRTARIVDEWFGRTVIRSQRELDYGSAQKVLDDDLHIRDELGAEFESVQRDLLLLRGVFRKLRERRLAAGALELHSVEVRFDLDAQNTPVALHTKEELEVMSMVAEYMILANVRVATFLRSVYPSHALLRRHAYPRQEAFAPVQRVAESLGVTLDTSSNKVLAEGLNKLAKAGPMVEKLVRGMATAAMAEAEYVSTGSGEDLYHYGLAENAYTHFTSPIRRYADLVVHRQLISALAHAPPPAIPLRALCQHLNARTREAKSVQRASAALFVALYVRHRTHIETSAVVTRILDDGCVLNVPSLGIQGVLRLKDSAGLRVPENALSLSPGSYESAVRVLDIEAHTGQAALLLHTNAGMVSLDLFDVVTVRISTSDSRNHAPQLQFALVHFGLDPHKKHGSKAKVDVVRHVTRDAEVNRELCVELEPGEALYAQGAPIAAPVSESVISNPLEGVPHIRMGQRRGRRTFGYYHHSSPLALTDDALRELPVRAAEEPSSVNVWLDGVSLPESQPGSSDRSIEPQPTSRSGNTVRAPAAFESGHSALVRTDRSGRATTWNLDDEEDSSELLRPTVGAGPDYSRYSASAYADDDAVERLYPSLVSHEDDARSRYVDDARSAEKKMRIKVVRRIKVKRKDAMKKGTE